MKKKYRLTFPIPGSGLLPGEYLSEEFEDRAAEWLEAGWLVDKTPKTKKAVKYGDRKNKPEVG